MAAANPHHRPASVQRSLSYSYNMPPLSQSTQHPPLSLSSMPPPTSYPGALTSPTSIIVRRLPRATSHDNIRSMLLFAGRLVDVDFVPNALSSEDPNFVSAIASFETSEAAEEARTKLHGKPNASNDANMIVELCSPNGSTAGFSSVLSRRNTTHNHNHAPGGLYISDLAMPLSAPSTAPGSATPTASNAPGSAVGSNGNVFSEPLPAPDSTNSRLPSLFSPQLQGHTSPTSGVNGNVNSLADSITLGLNNIKVSGKSLIVDGQDPDDDTGLLLENPVAYAQSAGGNSALLNGSTPAPSSAATPTHGVTVPKLPIPFSSSLAHPSLHRAPTLATSPFSPLSLSSPNGIQPFSRSAATAPGTPLASMAPAGPSTAPQTPSVLGPGMPSGAPPGYHALATAEAPSSATASLYHPHHQASASQHQSQHHIPHPHTHSHPPHPHHLSRHSTPHPVSAHPHHHPSHSHSHAHAHAQAQAQAQAQAHAHAQAQAHAHAHAHASPHPHPHAHSHSHPHLVAPPQQRTSYPPANPADQNPPCNTLYVGNLPHDTSEDELKALFSQQRGYKRLCFRNKANGPMCFVEFDDIPMATKALNELYGWNLSNSIKGGIRLSFSKNPLGVRSNNNSNNLNNHNGVANATTAAASSVAAPTTPAGAASVAVNGTAAAIASPTAPTTPTAITTPPTSSSR